MSNEGMSNDNMEMEIPDPGPTVKVPVYRTYDMRAAAIVAFNTAKQAGKDHDDCLDAAWNATIRARPCT